MHTAYLPEANVRVEIQQMTLYAGQSCSLIDAVKPAADFVAETPGTSDCWGF